jgi:hypothetical protein
LDKRKQNPIDQEYINQREQQLPADIGNQSPDMRDMEGALARAPIGEPPADFDVRSVYDSRPVQGYDFNITVSASVSGSVPYTTDLTFVVPKGLICVLRQIHHFFVSPPVIASRADVLLSVRVNNADFPFNKNIPVGVTSDDIAKHFIVADEFSRVTARFVTNVEVVIELAQIYAQFYGNFLVKTGLPAPFEIANRVGGSGKERSIARAPLRVG